MVEIEKLFKKMIENLEGFTKTDKIYQDDMKNFEGELKVQWNICGVKGYQIFEKDNYSYKFGEEIDTPDVFISINDENLASKFLKCEPFEFSYTINDEGLFEMTHTIGWKIVESELGSKREKTSEPFLTAQFNLERGLHHLLLSKLPIFRDFVAKQTGDEREYGSYLPINQSLGTFENQVLALKIFKHFIDKASNIVVRNCPCRVAKDCQDHSVELGCMFLGDDSLKMLVTKEEGYVATKEQAYEHIKKGIEDGMIPILGRAMSEAEGYGIEDTGHFLSVCLCCTCCCVNAGILTNVSASLTGLFHRMEGLTVKVDEDLCVGCEDCLEVCVFSGMEWIDEKAVVNQDRCLGCGRCETACQNGAISIILDDPNRIDEIIKTLETYVDVT